VFTNDETISSFGSVNCDNCLGVKTRSKFISNNCVKITCKSCRESFEFPLIELKKKIIYLDQNLFSTGFKNNKKPNTEKLLKIFEKLRGLTNKQLIVCPYSEAHDRESHLYEQSDQLWKFIRRESHYHNFYFASQIKERQLTNAYNAFLNDKQPIKSELYLYNALPESVHNWDDSHPVDIDFSITNLINKNTIGQEKQNFTSRVNEILPEWQKSSSSLEKDYQLEIKAHTDKFLKKFKLICESEPHDILELQENEDFRILFTLLELPEVIKTKNNGNILGFLKSRYFENVPYINISAGLWAIIKRKIKQKQILRDVGESKIKKEIQGLMSDFEHLSVFAPYCDAVFTEKRMGGYLKEWFAHRLGNYACKVFSAANLEEFNSYLDEIENNISPQMSEDLELAYGNN